MSLPRYPLGYQGLLHRQGVVDMNAVLSHTNVVTSIFLRGNCVEWKFHCSAGICQFDNPLERLDFFSFCSYLAARLITYSAQASSFPCASFRNRSDLCCTATTLHACSVLIRLELCFASILPGGPSVRWSLFHLDFYLPAHFMVLS